MIVWFPPGMFGDALDYAHLVFSRRIEVRDEGWTLVYA